MKYTLITKEPESNLIQKLTEEGFEIKASGIEYEVDAKDRAEWLFSILASYITITNAFNVLYKDMTKKDISVKSEFDAIYWIKDFIKETSYYQNNSNILIRDHFLTNTRLNVESFMRFNLKGMSQDIISGYTEVLRNIELENELIFEEGEMLADNMFENIRELLISKKISLEKFKEIHLYPEGKEMIIKDERNHQLSDESIANEVGVLFDFKQLETDSDLKEGLSTIILLVFILNIFEAKNLVIHQGIDEGYYNKVLEFIINMTNYSDKITHCAGCEFCGK